MKGQLWMPGLKTCFVVSNIYFFFMKQPTLSTLSEPEKKRMLEVETNLIMRRYRNKILKIDPDHFKLRRIRPAINSKDHRTIVPSQWPRERRQSMI